MAVTPQTEIRLLKVPFEIDNKNQLTFINKQAQTNYFTNLPCIEEDNCTYQRKDDVIRFPAHIDTLIEYNYVMYQNENYTDKWFYAYITNMRYINDNLTEISISTDVFQTWQFDIIYKNSFVEREHTNNDTIGVNTIDENLNVGDVVQEYTQEDVSLSQYSWLAISSSYNPISRDQFSGITIYNNNVFGNKVYLINMNPISNLVNFVYFLTETNIAGHIEDIKDVFIVPDALINVANLDYQSGTASSGGTYGFYTFKGGTTPETFNSSIQKRYSYTGFTPKNNKCFVYPYNYLFVSNNIGNHNIFKYENFNTEQCVFRTELALSVGVSGRLVPLNYKNMSQNDDEALPLAKYPTAGWSADSYTNWLTQNAINLPLNIFNGIMSPINKAVNSGNATTGAMTVSQDVVNQTANIIGSYYEASLQPNIEGIQSTGDVVYSAKKNTFTFRCMRAKNEYMKIIDDFFSMYGYKTNQLKIPNVTGRTNWNYVKTLNCNLLGDIPQEDLQEIKNIFDSGVTFWHNATTFLDYSQTNNIV